LTRPIHDLDLREAPVPAQQTESGAFTQGNILPKSRRGQKTTVHHSRGVGPEADGISHQAADAAWERTRACESAMRYGRRPRVGQHNYQSIAETGERESNGACSVTLCNIIDSLLASSTADAMSTLPL
jgi:hypothetical protein